MATRKPQRFKGKHRQVGQHQETPQFKNQRVKNRKSNKIAKQARKRNRS